MSPPPGPVDDLPVKATMKFAYRSVFSNLDGFARAAFLPLVLSVVLAFPAAALREVPPLAFLFGLVAVAVPYTLFGVAWYRLVLLGPAAAPALFPKWQPRHWLFFRYALLILLAGQTVVALVASQVLIAMPSDGEMPQPEPSMMLAALAVLLVLSVILLRLSLVFPATAVEETYSLGYAWRHTRGQGLRLLAASMLALLPLVLLGWLLLAVLFAGAFGGNQTGSAGAQLAFYVGENLLGYLSLGVTMAIIAAAFRTCAGWIPPSTGSPGQRVAIDRSPDGGEA